MFVLINRLNILKISLLIIKDIILAIKNLGWDIYINFKEGIK